MAVRIRMARHGTKKRPFYRIVVADQEAPRDGKFLEIVGTYNPIGKEKKYDFKKDRVEYWLQKGAQFTPTVKTLFKKSQSPKVA